MKKKTKDTLQLIIASSFILSISSFIGYILTQAIFGAVAGGIFGILLLIIVSGANKDEEIKSNKKH